MAEALETPPVTAYFMQWKTISFVSHHEDGLHSLVQSRKAAFKVNLEGHGSGRPHGDAYFKHGSKVNTSMCIVI